MHQQELHHRRIYPSFNPQGLGIIAPSIRDYGCDVVAYDRDAILLRLQAKGALLLRFTP